MTLVSTANNASMQGWARRSRSRFDILQVETGIPPLAVAQLFRVLPNNTAGMEIHNDASAHFITEKTGSQL